jgi:alpha-1,3-rhamnosyl/mannosyltransferase
VILPGFVDDADLGALYSGATLFVMPSLYEGFCIPVLEAMVCGTPVVCSNVSSLPEVVGDAALTFDPHDVRAMARAIERALVDEALRAQCIARGRTRAAMFTWRACAQRVLAVLGNVAKET